MVEDLHLAVLGKEDTNILCRYLWGEAFKKLTYNHVWGQGERNSLGDKDRVWPRSDFIVKIKFRAGGVCRSLNMPTDRLKYLY